MKLSKIAVATLVAQGLTLQAFAQNRDASDTIFNEPANGKGTQILLGIADIIGAHVVSPSITAEQHAIITAEQKLEVTKKLAITEEQRKIVLQNILDDSSSYLDDNNGNSRIGQGVRALNAEASRDYAIIKSTPLMSKAEKAALVERREIALAEARTTAIKAAQNMGMIDKTIRVARVGASVVFVLDAAARIYVWNALDANPTFSPVATYLQHQMKK